MAETARTGRPSRLPIFRTVLDTVAFCVRNAATLFAIAWFPYVLIILSELFLDWLIHGDSPGLPWWAFTTAFDPATWFAPLVRAILRAMIWVSVVAYMLNGRAGRSALGPPISRLCPIHIEVSRPVLLTASVLAMVSLATGALLSAKLEATLQIMMRLDFTVDETLSAIDAIFWSAEGAFVIVMSTILTACYPVAAMLARDGRLEPNRFFAMLRGNWLRLFAVVLIVRSVVFGISLLYEPLDDLASLWLELPDEWSARNTLLLAIVFLPLRMPSIVVWPVLMGIVLRTLSERAATQPAQEVAAAPAAS